MIKGRLFSQIGVKSASQCRKANDKGKSVVFVVVVVVVVFVVTKTVEHGTQCSDAGTQACVCRISYTEYFRGHQKITRELPANCILLL